MNLLESYLATIDQEPSSLALQRASSPAGKNAILEHGTQLVRTSMGTAKGTLPALWAASF